MLVGFGSRIETQILPLVKWIPIEQRVAFAAGAVAAKLRKSGRSIGFADWLIAACAVAHDLTLVTENVRHFERIEGLKYGVW